MEELEDILFPHEIIRPVQDILINEFSECLKKKKHLIAHAPTGIGKTSILGPALSFAIKKKLTVFFLTSRHTQHDLAIKTLGHIKDRHKINFLATDLIGKRWMCNFEGITGLNSKDFADFCKSMKEENKCEYYANIRLKNGKISPLANQFIETIKSTNPNTTEQVIELSKDQKVCSYEMSIELAKVSDVIITDYYYIFSDKIRDNFFKRTKKELENSIIIVDEGHNLPSRIRELMSNKLTTNMTLRAIKEAKKYYHMPVIEHIVRIQDALNRLSKKLQSGQEKLVTKEEFLKIAIGTNDIDEVLSDIEFVAEAVREKQQKSYLSGIAHFLESWSGPDDGFSRFISYHEFKSGPLTLLTYKCLDPSLITSDIINKSYMTVLMSGTLSPTETYKDLLGFPKNTKLLELKTPFPKKNRLNLIVPLTSTKYSTRSEKQYEKMAKICSDIANIVPGNIAIFFPSYAMRDEIYRFFKKDYKKRIFLEDSKLTKEEKLELLIKFKKAKDAGSCLLAISAANFAEGIDLPGDLLKAVIVVGLPLQKPTIETKELISYYDDKFGSGWEYGYVFPAFTKTLQTAGRCIRDKDDKGVIVFLDSRYTWKNYLQNFPQDWDMVISEDYKSQIQDFFLNNS